MELKNCLKVSYQGQLRYINCEVGCHYEDILKLVSENFKIPAELKQSLVVANEHGYIFEKHIFEYFILLFPRPKITFHIRLEHNKTANSNADDAPANAQDSRVPFGYSRSNNKRSRARNVDDNDYQAVPVRRQNCFIGEMPSMTAGVVRRQNSVDMSQTAGISRRHNADDFSKPLAKRLRLMDSVQKKPRSLSKRSLRI